MASARSFNRDSQREREDEPPRKVSRGVDTFGRPIVSHIDVVHDQYMAYMKQITDTNEYLLSPGLRGQPSDWKQKNFGVFWITPYCKLTKRQLVPSEFSFVVFSFEAGIKEFQSGFIDPGELPFAEQGETKINCEINGLPFPGKDEHEFVPPLKFHEIVVQLTEKYGLFMGDDYLFFCPRFDNNINRACLKWIYTREELKDCSKRFDVLNLEVLLMEMSKLVDDPDNTPGVITHEGGACKFIRDTRFDYMGELACKWHQTDQAIDKIDRCAQNIVLRYIYNSLFYLCHLFGREITPLTHAPYKKGDPRFIHLPVPDVPVASPPDADVPFESPDC